jgi:hypothetical protein
MMQFLGDWSVYCSMNLLQLDLNELDNTFLFNKTSLFYVGIVQPNVTKAGLLK